jgi:hypothetical protein
MTRRRSASDRFHQFVHRTHLLRIRFPFRYRRQHRTPQTQRPDLHTERRRVRCGDLGQRGLPRQYAPDRGQINIQLAQRSNQLQASQGIHVVQAVTSRAVTGRRNDPPIGIEPNGLHRQSGPRSQSADREEVLVVHDHKAALSPLWRLKSKSPQRQIAPPPIQIGPECEPWTHNPLVVGSSPARPTMTGLLKP